jgi:hypothetical protein
MMDVCGAEQEGQRYGQARESRYNREYEKCVKRKFRCTWRERVRKREK